MNRASRTTLGAAAFALVLVFSGQAAVSRWDNALLRKVTRSKDVAWLEGIAGALQKALELKPKGGMGGTVGDLRTAAYARLGALGTEDSLAAADRIEERAKRLTLTPETLSIELWPGPSWHFADVRVKILAETKAPDGRTHGIVLSGMLGGRDLFLISSRTPDNKASWSRPKLIPWEPCRNIQNPSLTLQGEDTLVLLFAQKKRVRDGAGGGGAATLVLEPQKRTASIRQVLLDQDGDGWTDVEEARLGTDSAKDDTDGDGISDGMDTCPAFPRPKDRPGDEETEILQRAFFATFGLGGARHMLAFSARSRKVHVWGYSGPVFFKANPRGRRGNHGEGSLSVRWSIGRGGAHAVVDISDYAGPLAGGSQSVFLRKIRGRWTVIDWEAGLVS